MRDKIEHSKIYTCKNGRIVSLEIEKNMETVNVYSSDRNLIGAIEFVYQENEFGDSNNVYLLIHMELDKQGDIYKRQGIGEECLRFFIDCFDALIVAREENGYKYEDGSYLVDDGVHFVAAMRKKNLIAPLPPEIGYEDEF